MCKVMCPTEPPSEEDILRGAGHCLIVTDGSLFRKHKGAILEFVKDHKNLTISLHLKSYV